MARVCESCRAGKDDACFLSSSAASCVACTGAEAGRRMERGRRSLMRFLNEADDHPGVHRGTDAAPSIHDLTDGRTGREDRNQVAANNRRARDRGLPATLTVEEWRTVKRGQRFRCACCGARTETLTLDHVKPLCFGGGTTTENVQGLCHMCNAVKNKAQRRFARQQRRRFHRSGPRRIWTEAPTRPSSYPR